MRALIRILVLIPLGYVAASIAAGMVAAFSVYELAGDPDFGMEGFVVGAGIVIGMYFGAFALAPAVCLIILAEAFAWRSFFIFTPAGGAIALGETLFMNQTIAYPPMKVVTMVACGLVGGAVYWAIAGRQSGKGFSDQDSEPPKNAFP